MKTLTLIRHAKSSWKYPDLADYDRPLNKRGRRDAAMMAERLAARGFGPQRILTSPA
jgi:phosphohistidine phosphatase